MGISHATENRMPAIHDNELIDFLQWALPKMGYRWPGFRKVRGQVKSCISGRLEELGIGGLGEYRRRLKEDRCEWERLDVCCRITISRFYRDRKTWDGLRHEVLPELASAARGEGREVLQALSIGCASGEEPYTLRLCWELDEERPWEGLGLEISAFDAGDHMVERARAARYPWGTLKELPEGWVERAFDPVDGEYELRERFRYGVSFFVADLREWGPGEDRCFDVVFCRNLAFMYFDEAGREETLERLARWVRPGGVLVVGNRDVVPERPGLFDVGGWDAPFVSVRS